MLTSLTSVKIKHAIAKRSEKAQKLFDGRGLFLLIPSKGNPGWRLKYRFRGIEKSLSLGIYPDVTLSQARDARAQALSLLANGINPSDARKANRQAGENTFAALSQEWLTSKVEPVRTPDHIRTVKGRLKVHLLPRLGRVSVREITAPMILDVLKRIEATGKRETARRCLQICSQVLRYAVQTGKAESDPTPALKGALLPATVKSHAAVTTPDELKPILNAFDGYEGTLIVKSALRLAPLVFVRPGELRQMEWSEINFIRGLWEIPASKMKMKRRESHIVPLSSQSLAILLELVPVTRERSRYVFPSFRSTERPMSNNAILSALRSLGIEKDVMSGHGFRATARTLLDEELHQPVAWIERQLAHAVKDVNGDAYNRTQFLPDRVKMMQTWADYLDELKASSVAVLHA